MKKHLSIILIILFCISMSGCIKEDLSDCIEEGVYLKLRYSSHTVPDRIELEDINRLSLFIYNENDKLIKISSMSEMRIIDRYTLFFPLQTGKYKFIIWTGAKEEYYTIFQASPFINTLSESQIKLNRDIENRVLFPPSELHYGQFAIEKEEEQSTIIVDLQRVTSNIRVIMRGLDNENRSPHTFTIEANNGTLDFENLAIQEDETLIYEPEYGSISRSNSLIGYFTIMKLRTGRNTFLKLYDKDKLMIEKWDLINEIILKYPEATLQSGGDYEIIFSFNDEYVPFSITINGWEVLEEEILE